MTEPTRRTRATLPAHIEHTQTFFIDRTAERVARNLSWIASATADQAMLAGAIHASPTVTEELSRISARLDRLAIKIGGES